MDGKGSISDYRNKLDKTLESPDLTNDETLRTLVKNQIQHAAHLQSEENIGNVVEKRTKEVSNFLCMLRSASVTYGGKSKPDEVPWKVKQDTEELRVMYREGPEGTPFHTLLVEGFVDGPVDVCLCISSEAGLYKKWWPQIAIPTFKVISSKRLKRVTTCEQISLVRMKVSWPLSSREALIHYFVFEYFQDGLVVVLLNSISDSETVDISTHGFTRDGLPNAQDVVRIDVVGGFALQKVSANRSYFRTIANIDIKLDFVPPALINFISRQLIGSGFRLYKKEVASVAKGDEEFREALKDPLYTSIREALYSENTHMDQESMSGSMSVMLEEKLKQDNDANTPDDSTIASNSKYIDGESHNVTNEIQETNGGQSQSADESMYKSPDEFLHEITEEITGDNQETNGDRNHENTYKSSDDLNEITEEITGDNGVDIRAEVAQPPRTTNEIAYDFVTEVAKKKKNVAVSPEVKRALEILEKAISTFRESKRIRNNPEEGQSDVSKENSVKLEVAVEESTAATEEADAMIREEETCEESSKIGSTELTSSVPLLNSSENHGSSSRITEYNSYPRETKASKIAPAASPVEELTSLSHLLDVVSPPAVNQKTDSTAFEKKKSSHPLTNDANGVNGDMPMKRKGKRSKFSCFYFISRQ